MYSTFTTSLEHVTPPFNFLLSIQTFVFRQNGAKYAGHYIFLLHFDPNTDEVRFLDPSQDSGVKYISSSILDNARSQPGTDKDIIIIWKKKAPE